jgi:hypothetical protein
MEVLALMGQKQFSGRERYYARCNARRDVCFQQAVLKASTEFYLGIIQRHMNGFEVEDFVDGTLKKLGSVKHLDKTTYSAIFDDHNLFAVDGLLRRFLSLHAYKHGLPPMLVTDDYMVWRQRVEELEKLIKPAEKSTVPTSETLFVESHDDGRPKSRRRGRRRARAAA